MGWFKDYLDNAEVVKQVSARDIKETILDGMDLKGFRFVGLTKDGNEYDCIVLRDSYGLYCAFESNGKPVFDKVISWRNHEKH